MLDSFTIPLYNNGNGLGSGGYVRADEEEEKNNTVKLEDLNLKEIKFLNIFDELAEVISTELTAMGLAQKANMNFNNLF